jgi:hypothetical protein
MTGTLSLTHHPKPHKPAVKVSSENNPRADVYYRNVVRSKTEWPTHDYSIKTLAKYLGFTWRDTDPTGAASIGMGQSRPPSTSNRPPPKHRSNPALSQLRRYVRFTTGDSEGTMFSRSGSARVVRGGLGPFVHPSTRA